MFIEDWVEYACFDAEITYFLFNTLQRKLKQVQISDTKNHENLQNTWNLYNKYWRPFGKLITDMERTGFKVNVQHLRNAEIQANNDKKL